MTKMNTLEMMAGNVFNLQDFEENKIKFKQIKKLSRFYCYIFWLN